MYLNMHPPHLSAQACTSLTASVLLFLTEFNEHICSEDKRGWRNGAKSQRGEWGANREGCGQAEDERLQSSITAIILIRNASSSKLRSILLSLTFDPLGLN